MLTRVQRSVVLGSVAELPTKREALRRLEERLRPLNQGIVLPHGTLLFASFVESQWSVLVLPTLKRSTQRSYGMVLRAHLAPHWNTWPLRNIGRLDIQQFVAEKFRQGCGWQTVRNTWVLLSGILETAVEYGYLTVNPARGVKFPPPPRREAPAILAGATFVRLLEALDEPHRTMVALIAATGLRVGELLALRWQALDLEVRTLQVRESVFQGAFQQPKTRRAERTIPLGPHTVALLTAHRARVTRSAPTDLVFGNQSGGPLRETRLLQRVLKPAAERAGLGRVTWHQFRHVHSSLLNDLRVPVKIAQEQLGHASIQTTLNIYTHVVDASHRHAIETLEGALFPSVPKPGNDPDRASALNDGGEGLEIGGAARI